MDYSSLCFKIKIHIKLYTARQQYPPLFIHFSQEPSSNELVIIFPLDSGGHWDNEELKNLAKVNANKQSGCASTLNYPSSPGHIISLSTLNYFDFLRASIVKWRS